MDNSYNEGLKAYNNGDFQGAKHHFQEASRQGHPKADTALKHLASEESVRHNPGAFRKMGEEFIGALKHRRESEFKSS